MVSAFSQLNYTTHWAKNMTKQHLLDLVTQIALLSISEELRSSFIAISFVFSGHGGEGDTLYMQDGGTISLYDEIIKPLITSESLSSFPKLFFIDACRGGEDTNAYSVKTHPNTAKRASGEYVSLDGNCFVAYATISKKKAFMRNASEGSVWMQELAKQLKESNDSVQNIVSKINKNIWDKYDDSSIHRSQQPQATDMRLNCGPLYLRRGNLKSVKPCAMIMSCHIPCMHAYCSYSKNIGRTMHLDDTSCILGQWYI